MKSLLDNWKTTSAGLIMIIGAVVHLVFAILHKTADETTWLNSLGAILGGVGLLAAGDASKSQEQVQKVEQKVDETTKAVITGDTSTIAKQVVGEKTTNP